jgi:hypothetical protein
MILILNIHELYYKIIRKTNLIRRYPCLNLEILIKNKMKMKINIYNEDCITGAKI